MLNTESTAHAQKNVIKPGTPAAVSKDDGKLPIQTKLYSIICEGPTAGNLLKYLNVRTGTDFQCNDVQNVR